MKGLSTGQLDIPAHSSIDVAQYPLGHCTGLYWLINIT